MLTFYDMSKIAKICHEANKAYCEMIGDLSQSHWDHAPEWQSNSAIEGVKFCVENKDASVSANHDAWYAHKEKEGWKYGAKKDAEKKEHPCMVPYDQLPVEQRRKDHLFKAIVGVFL